MPESLAFVLALVPIVGTVLPLALMARS